MRNLTTISNNFGILGFLFGVGSAIYAAYQTKKLNDATEKIGMTMDEVSKKAPVDIQQSVIDRAIDLAVNREVKRAVEEAVKAVRGDLDVDISKQVRKEVESNLKEIKDRVSDSISDQVANIDEYALKETVVKQAEQKILRKFDGALDGILGDYKRQLQNVTKVWDSVSDALNRNRNSNDEKKSFHFSLE